MRCPVAAPENKIAEYIAFSILKYCFRRVFDRRHLCAGDKLTLAVTAASVDRLYAEKKLSIPGFTLVHFVARNIAKSAKMGRFLFLSFKE